MKMRILPEAARRLAGERPEAQAAARGKEAAAPVSVTVLTGRGAAIGQLACPCGGRRAGARGAEGGGSPGGLSREEPTEQKRGVRSEAAG